MTFANDTARTIFHELPTEKQLTYTRLEEQLAFLGKVLRIEAVMRNGDALDVMIRISEKLDS